MHRKNEFFHSEIIFYKYHQSMKWNVLVVLGHRLVFCSFFLNMFFSWIFRQKGREREGGKNGGRERDQEGQGQGEKYQCSNWLPLVSSCTHQTCSLRMGPDWELNQQRLCAQVDVVGRSTSHHQGFKIRTNYTVGSSFSLPTLGIHILL